MDLLIMMIVTSSEIRRPPLWGPPGCEGRGLSMQISGCWFLVTGSWPLVAGHWLIETGHWLLSSPPVVPPFAPKTVAGATRPPCSLRSVGGSGCGFGLGVRPKPQAQSPSLKPEARGRRQRRSLQINDPPSKLSSAETKTMMHCWNLMR